MAVVRVEKRNSRDAPEKRSAGNGGSLFWLQPGQVLPQGYFPISQNEDVKKCIHILADLVSNMTIKLMENGENGDYRIKDELSKKIDINPNNLMTRKNFIYNIVKDACEGGNKVAAVKTNGVFIENIVPWEPSTVSFINISENGYQIMHNGQIFEPDEVLHFVINPSSRSPYIGEGFTATLKQTVKDLAQAQATKSAFLKSEYKPSLIITTNSDDESMQTEEGRKNILDSYVTKTSQGEPWIIPAGEIEVKTIQPLSLNDLAISDTMQLDKRSIARAFGIPPFLIGVGEFNKEAYNHFVATTILSIAMSVQQELTKKLLISDKRYFQFNIESLMQYSIGEKVNYVKEMVGGGILNRNEARNKLGESPVDDKGMNEYVVLENYVPVAKIGDQKKLRKEGEADGKKNPDDDGEL